MQSDKSVPDLVKTLEHKDKLYNAVNVTLRILTLIGVVILLILSGVQTERLQNHIDCIVSLFTHPNRQQLIVSDIEHCKITTGN